MKKIFLCAILATISLLTFSQTYSGKWNRSMATYTNPFHKITWQLIEELDWIERPILSGSTLLKVRNDETQLLVKLGANKKVGLNGDIWDLISEQEPPQLEKMRKQQAQDYGMQFLGVKSMKSQLCGFHAIKKRIDMKKDYPDYGQAVHCIEIEYIFYKSDYIYTVSVMTLSVLDEEISLFDKISTQLFNGFIIK